MPLKGLLVNKHVLDLSLELLQPSRESMVASLEIRDVAFTHIEIILVGCPFSSQSLLEHHIMILCLFESFPLIVVFTLQVGDCVQVRSR